MDTNLKKKFPKCLDHFERETKKIPLPEGIYNTPDLLYDRIMDGDPTEKKELCLWLFQQYKFGQLDLKKIEDIRYELQFFLTFIGDIKLIRTLNYYELKNNVDNFIYFEFDDENFELVKDDENVEYKIFFQNPADKKPAFYQPLTQEASCQLGKNTKWCISSTISANLFQDYISQDAELYIWIDKKGSKYVFVFGDQKMEINDSQNREIKKEKLFELMNHPILKSFFNKKFNEKLNFIEVGNIEIVLFYLQWLMKIFQTTNEYVESYKEKILEKILDYFERNDEIGQKFSNDFIKFIRLFIKKRIPEFEEKFLFHQNTNRSNRSKMQLLRNYYIMMDVNSKDWNIGLDDPMWEKMKEILSIPKKDRAVKRLKF